MFRQGFKEGQGVFSVASGDQYRGQFVRGQRGGQGIEVILLLMLLKSQSPKSNVQSPAVPYTLITKSKIQIVF